MARLFEPLGIKCTFRVPPKSGSAGLSCRGRDVAVFAQMLLNKGMYDHRRYFKSVTVERYTGPNGMWSKPTGSDWTNSLFSGSSFGHISSSGPLLWIDPEKQLFVVLLTARADSSKPGRIEEAQRILTESIIAKIANNQ
jgi:serine-type D-Ala-D-Ala carboxypeptidase